MSLNTFPCNPYPISTEELNKGNNDDLNTRVSALETAVEEIDNDKADLGVIAAEFDAEAGTYEIGDLVTNEGKLYEFTSDHSAPGAWDPTEVTEKTVADEVNSVKSGLTNDNFNVTTNSNFTISQQRSHYITNKVVHVCLKLKVVSIPDENPTHLFSLPQGMSIYQYGMTIPLFKSNSLWGTPSTIIYGYIDNYGIAANKDDLTVDSYIIVDLVLKLV